MKYHVKKLLTTNHFFLFTYVRFLDEHPRISSWWVAHCKWWQPVSGGPASFPLYSGCDVATIWSLPATFVAGPPFKRSWISRNILFWHVWYNIYAPHMLWWSLETVLILISISGYIVTQTKRKRISCIKISNQGVDCPLILFVSNADCKNCLKLYSRKIAPTLVLHGYHFVILHYFMAHLPSMQVREITPFYC